MRKTLCLTLAAALAALAVPAALEAEIEFRLTGGMSLQSGGDLNRGAQGMFEFYDALFRALGYVTRGEFTPAQAGYSVGGDIIFRFHTNFGIGLGAGYMSAALTSVDEFQGAAGGGEASHKVAASALPLRLNLFYFLPVGGGEKFNVVCHAGLGYYLARAGYTFRLDSGGGWLEQEYDCSANGLGFHGGIGLEVALSPQFGLVFEAVGRYADIGGFEGDKTVRNSAGGSASTPGTLTYFELNAATGTFSMLDVTSSDISGPGIDEVRDARVHFSGLSLSVGAFLRF
jgi:hypothetical protein